MELNKKEPPGGRWPCQWPRDSDLQPEEFSEGEFTDEKMSFQNDESKHCIEGALRAILWHKKFSVDPCSENRVALWRL